MNDAILCPWGHRHLLPIRSAECWNEADAKTPPRRVPVTLREYDVLTELLRDGVGNREIGKRLFLSEDTVKSHVKGLLRRTGADNRTELLSAIFRGRVHVVPVPVASTQAALVASGAPKVVSS